MSARKETNRRTNIFNFVASVGVFGTGLIMFFLFHVGHGGSRMAFMGFEKIVWLNIHRGMAIAFLAGFAIHIALHEGYIKNIIKRCGTGLSKKMRNTSLQQLLLLIESTVVTVTGFYAWVMFPKATLAEWDFHCWINIHNIVALILLAGLTVHIKRRWRRLYRRIG